MSETNYELALRRLKEIAALNCDPLASALASQYLRNLASQSSTAQSTEGNGDE